MPWPSNDQILRLRRSPAVTRALDEVDARFPEFVRATRDLAEIPAPSFGEGARAEWVAAQLGSAGIAATIDGSGSVVSALPGAEPGVLFAAHADTVFRADEDHRVSGHDGRLAGRGIGDNSIGVAALVFLARFLAGLGRRRAVWLAATTGEEGLGDLRGIRSVVDGLSGRLGACVAIEGHFLGRVVVGGVGSWRARVVLRGPGGHSWHDHGRPNPIHAIGELVAELGLFRMPARPRTTLSVGRIGGGQGVNVIAEEAWLEIDVRSESQDKLDALARRVGERAGAVAARHDVTVETVPLGARPAGAIGARHPLVRCATAALDATGSAVALEAASTDANYPLSLGIPSVCVGVSRGAGMHTAGEWVEQEAARQGLRQIAVLAAILAGVRP